MPAPVSGSHHTLTPPGQGLARLDRHEAQLLKRIANHVQPLVLDSTEWLPAHTLVRAGYAIVWRTVRDKDSIQSTPSGRRAFIALATAARARRSRGKG